MKLIIVHCHLRPGGVRRIIELATPHIVRASSGEFTSVTLAVGEAPDRNWQCVFKQALGDTPVEFIVAPTFGYFSEQRLQAASLRRRIRVALRSILGDERNNTVVWAHNLGLARNLILTDELTRTCELRNVPLLAHHHDWWFDNRWQRWSEAQRAGFRTLDAIAEAVFGSARVHHCTINRADAAVLKRHATGRVTWLPNLVNQALPPSPTRVGVARQWLRRQLGDDAPVWLLPCRLLRRKNVAEALLLTRWLRPEAWLVTTGGVSSADEEAYRDKLDAAARAHRWRLRLGVLHGNESRKPGVPELLAASETVLLTSIQEGFGLPYLEAAAARRPLIARSLPNIAPDLKQFGFSFPQSYEELLIATELFDWKGERSRQITLFRKWQRNLPPAIRRIAREPRMLTRERAPEAVSFSRLTLSAQIEVLAHPASHSWEACVALNPFLKTWQRRASRGELQVTRWPRTASRWLSPRAYAQRFSAILRNESKFRGESVNAAAVQQDFFVKKLAAPNLYPLLWASVV